MMMPNQKTLKALYHSVYDPFEYEDEDEYSLYHHGVMGMSWGDRHGPPYPLGGVDKKIARAEAKAKKEAERKQREMNRRMKKLRRAAKKKRKKDQREMTRQEKLLRKKQQLLDEGDLEKIRKNSKLFTNEEIQWATERHDLIEQSKGHKKQKKVLDEQRLQQILKVADATARVASNAATVINAASSVKNFYDSIKDREVKETKDALDIEIKQLDKKQKEADIRNKNVDAAKKSGVEGLAETLARGYYHDDYERARQVQSSASSSSSGGSSSSNSSDGASRTPTVSRAEQNYESARAVRDSRGRLLNLSDPSDYRRASRSQRRAFDIASRAYDRETRRSIERARRSDGPSIEDLRERAGLPRTFTPSPDSNRASAFTSSISGSRAFNDVATDRVSNVGDRTIRTSDGRTYTLPQNLRGRTVSFRDYVEDINRRMATTGRAQASANARTLESLVSSFEAIPAADVRDAMSGNFSGLTQEQRRVFNSVMALNRYGNTSANSAIRSATRT